VLQVPPTQNLEDELASSGHNSEELAERVSIASSVYRIIEQLDTISELDERISSNATTVYFPPIADREP